VGSEFFISGDKAMFGVDYPHFESILPSATATLAEFLGHPAITDEIARKVLYENAARTYGFDLDALQPHFERVGFNPAEVVAAAA
jgi:predicted TIM-barrel fold metal-dependent hydrolase